MPKLSGNVQTTKLWLPSSKDEPNEADRGWIEVRSKLLAGDMVDIDEIEGNAKKGLFALTRIIQKWNLADNTNDELIAEINEENIRQMGDDDFEFLSEWVMVNIIKARKGVDDDEKKSFSSTSVTASTPTETTSQVQDQSESRTTSIPIS